MSTHVTSMFLWFKFIYLIYQVFHKQYLKINNKYSDLIKLHYIYKSKYFDNNIITTKIITKTIVSLKKNVNPRCLYDK